MDVYISFLSYTYYNINLTPHDDVHIISYTYYNINLTPHGCLRII